MLFRNNIIISILHILNIIEFNKNIKPNFIIFPCLSLTLKTKMITEYYHI